MQPHPIPPDDELLVQRFRFTYPLAVAGIVIFTFLATVNLRAGRSLLGGVLLVLVAFLAVDVVAYHLRRALPIRFAVILVPMLAAASLGVVEIGFLGAIWTFPTIVVAYFMLPRRWAITAAVVAGAVTTGLIAWRVEAGVAVRYLLSFGVTVGAIHVMLRTVETLQARLVEQSRTDPLTGALNRRALPACLGDALERHRRTGAPASALALDIDHFKAVNDRLGHDAGDEVLRQVAAAIDARARRLDSLFRMGGEEFLLLLPDTALGEARVVAEAVRRTVAAVPLADGGSVTVSIGASALRDGDTLDAFLKRADEALYAAKDEGRNRVALERSAL